MDWPAVVPRLAVLSSFDEDAVGIDMTIHVSPVTPASSAWPVANKAILIPCTLRVPFLVRKCFWVNGSAVAGNVDVGVYSMGGARILSTGSTAQSGTSVIQSAAPSAGSVLLTPGSYYLALAASSASATFFTNSAGGPGVADLQFMGLAEKTTAMPLPDPITLATIVSTTVPLFGIADVTTI